MLEKTKISKILVRLTKKAGDECKGLAQKILHNATLASRTKSTVTKLEAPDSPLSINSNQSDSRKPASNATVSRRPDAVAGIKRQRETDPIAQLATKRTVVPASAKPLAKA